MYAVMNFTGKVALITGSSSGIGAETAIHFARHGAKVALLARGLDGLQLTKSRCCQEAKAQEKDILTVVCDVTKEDDVKRAVSEVVSEFGRLDILVNNAGATFAAGFEATSLENFDRMLNVNLRSTFIVTKEAQSHIIQAKGAIVNTSSIAGTRPIPYLFGYSVAKAAVEQFTKCLAIELAPKGVRVNAVSPGVILTDIFKRPGAQLSGSETMDEFLARMAPMHPMQRNGEVQEVANAILWLASDQSSFTTGTSIPIDGGRHATTWFSAPKK